MIGQLSILRLPLVAAVFALVGCSDSAQPKFVRQVEWADHGVWIKGDTHIHTGFSDGGNTVAEVAAKAKDHGCDVIAITDHADQNLRAATPEYEEAITVARRQFPGLMVLAGVEWNVPPGGGDEHAAVLVPPGPDEFLRLAEFKSRFDDLGRTEHDPVLALEALEWLNESFPAPATKPVVIYNHPNRKTNELSELLPQWQEWRKAGDVLVALEGGPGHQASKILGSYKGNLSLVDRWDPAVATVGGAWDRLLQDGVDLWGALATSDFHNTSLDFWPGQFSETWFYVPERTPEGVLRALRAGTFFGSHGHIARQVQLQLRAKGLPRPAYVGEAVSLATDTPVAVELTCRVPDTDWTGAPNRLDRLELVAITAEGARIIEEHAPTGDGSATLTTTITVPPGGIVLRARGRREVEDGPDLLFYTNPVRVQAVDASWLARSVASFRQLSPKNLTGIALLAVTLISLLATAVARLMRRPVTTTDIEHAPCPRVPQARHYALAAAASLAFAIYGSLLPFRFDSVPLGEGLSRFRQVLDAPISLDRRVDWGVNVLLMIPAGFLGLGALTVDRLRPVRKTLAVIVVIAGTAAISVAVECVQIWLPERTSSVNDILAQLIGTSVGVLLWLLLGQRVTRAIRAQTGSRSPNDLLNVLLQAYLLGLILYSLMPLDVALHPVEIYRKYKAGRIAFHLVWPGFGDALVTVLLNLPAGILAARIWRRPAESVRGFARSAPLGVGLVLLIELGQVVVQSRFAAVTDVLIGSVGVVAGILVARRLPPALPASPLTRRGRVTRALVDTTLAATYAAFLCAYYWWPLKFSVDHDAARDALRGLTRLPFRVLYTGNPLNAATQLFKKVLLFVPLGVVLGDAIGLTTMRWRARAALAVAACLACLVLATGIEAMQALLPPHVPDSTDVLFYTTGACLGLQLTLRFHTASPQPGVATCRADVAPSPRTWEMATARVAAAITGLAVALVGGTTWHMNQKVGEQPAPCAERSYAERSGSLFEEEGVAPAESPMASEIAIPAFEGSHAIWGATGRDDEGRVWFGVSAAGVPASSARLFQYDARTGEVAECGDALSQLERLGLRRPGESQMKIHSKIVQADDGYLYFASMDEQGEKEDGSRLPTWGSHFWRLHPDHGDWEHLFAAPEGLIAVGGVGRWVYALGYFDHVLYQYDTQTQTVRSERVGAFRGHVSRNFLTDTNGHAYVPRLIPRRTGGSVESADDLAATLVELDHELRKIGETPLEQYGGDGTDNSHGIVSFVYLADGSIVFATHLGYLYQVRPRVDGPAAVTPLGWFHPEGAAYVPSLFTISGTRYLVGVGHRPRRSHEWLVFDLETHTSQAAPLELRLRDGDSGDLLLYGSVTRDATGAAILGGRLHNATGNRPILLRVPVTQVRDAGSLPVAAPASTGGTRIATDPEVAGRPSR